MTHYIDADVFEQYNRVTMMPCSAPDSTEFEDDNDTIILANIAGELRKYSYNGAKVQYQTFTLSAKIDAD